MTEAVAPTPTRHSRLGLPVRIVRSRPRLFIGMACAVIVGILLPVSWRAATKLLIGWNVGCLIYFVLSGIMVVRSQPD